MYMCIICSVCIVLASACSYLFLCLASNQTTEVKMQYFRKLMFLSTTWYDLRKVDEIASNFMDNITNLTIVWHEKLHVLIVVFGTGIGGLVVGFVKGATLALLFFSLAPVIIVSFGIFAMYIHSGETIKRDSYGEAGAVSDECFTYIKSIKSLNGEDHETKRYIEKCKKARIASVNFGLKAGVFFGIATCVIDLV